MADLTRIRLRWLQRRWPALCPRLTWALPASAALVVVSYDLWLQLAVIPARPWSLFWIEIVLFGILGPLIGWRLLRARYRLETHHRAITAQHIALHKLSATMNRATSLSEAAHMALTCLAEALQIKSGQIYAWDAAAQTWSELASYGAPARPDWQVFLRSQAAAALTPEQSVALQRNCPESVGPTLPAAQPGRSTAIVPLQAGRRTLGLLHVEGEPASCAMLADPGLGPAIGAQIGTALESTQLREEVSRVESLTVLLQEMHHRIKNNLQTVADLLSLEMANSASPEARKSLHDSISRIKSIAAVHQLLSLEQLRLTNITELARQVCDISLRHLTLPGAQIAAEVSGPPIYLPSKQATALALVMNELVSNALEHAFAENGRTGKVLVSLAQEGAQVTVTVADDGRGLPSQFDLQQAQGLGLQIARTLVEKDLGGVLRLENSPTGGCRVTLTFYK